jgi:single-stranded-DNA-specific exonuclease
MKIIQKGNYTGDIIETTLENRNIEDLELFHNPENAPESDPLEFTNTRRARDILLKTIATRGKVVILVDADADGYTSATILYSYIKDISADADVEYIVHSTKAHGLSDEVMKEIYEIEPHLVITPDAGSNDVRQIEELEGKEIKVIVLDHHHVTEFTEAGVIVNNQLCPMTNDNFVGAGVVYKFIQGIDEDYGYDFADKYLDLVAVGQIGDSSDISNPEIRKLVLRGVSKITNPFLKTAVNNQIGFGKKIAPKDLSFTVIPLINAVTRVGTIEERELLFEALAGIGSDRQFVVEKKKKNKATGKFDKIQVTFNLVEYAYDTFTKTKARQQALIKKLLPAVQESVKDDSGIVIAFTPEDTPGISGLVANKLAQSFDKPALLLNEKETNYAGSGRGNEKVLSDFREWCEKSNLVEFAQGHDNAFGISIHKDNMEAFKEYARTVKKQETVYEVDILTDKPDKKVCEDIDKNRHLFGGVVSEPLVGIVGLTVPKRFLGLKGSVLNIYSWGVTIVQFNTDPTEYETLMEYPEDYVKLNIVGTYSINEWTGRRVPQLIIRDYEIVYDSNEDEVNEDNIIF